MIRLLAIDLDGTLLTPSRTIHPKAIEAISRAKEAGVIVLLASGRIRPSMLKFAQVVGLADGPMICGNGTHAMLSSTVELMCRPLNHQAQELLIAYAWANDLHLNLYARDSFYFLRDTPWGDLYRARVETIAPETLTKSPRELSCIKVMIVDKPERIAGHLALLGPQVESTGTRATESEPEYLEFMDSGANKGSALATMADRLGIMQSETASIGDYLNDVEMLEWAGLSGAMRNGHPAAKSAASVVVGSNEEGGVAEFIEQFVLKHSV